MSAAALVLLSAALAADPFDRSSLPIREPPAPTITTLDVRDAAPPPPRFEPRAPDGAPNVVVVLLDDVGFGQTSTFGGAVETPTLDRLADEGLRYTQFHTAALCSPTRTALLTGRNHHSNNSAAITEGATGYPGYTSVRPQDITPLAEILRLNGYSTAAFGKSHETPSWEATPAGPFDRWPTGSGFEKFYGFLGGETNQWSPQLYEGTRRIEPPADPDYHLSSDLADQAIRWVRVQRELKPDEPFFLYFATGAAHAPHHAPREWVERYAGRFDEGWDVYREQTLARQLDLGIVPRGTKLAPKPEAIRDWKDLSDDERRLFARQMEVFAGFLSHADHEVGRLVDELERLDVLDDTVVIYVAGDNGASAEGGAQGVFNEGTYFNEVREPLSAQLDRIDALGGPTTYSHYASGWAVAGDTPFAWTKQVASSYGGTRNGMVVRYPRGIDDAGGVRTQWHHVIDVAPTVLELARVPEPETVDGIVQHPIEGVSFAYSFDEPDAPSRHTKQYFEMFGNRGIYQDGWLAGTVHIAPWDTAPRAPLADDVWELYDTRADFSLSRDLARKHPARVRQMQEAFLEEAIRHHVLPIDDRRQRRFDPAIAGRPDPMGGRTSITLGPGTVGLVRAAFPRLLNRSSVITARVRLADEAGDGAIVAQGGRFGGWSLHVDDGRPAFTYNWVGLERYEVRSDVPLGAGTHTVRWVFDYDGGGRGLGGAGRLYVDDALVAEGRIPRTHANAFGIESADVGTDLATPVTEVYAAHPTFPGEVEEVTIEVGPTDDRVTAVPSGGRLDLGAVVGAGVSPALPAGGTPAATKQPLAP